MGRNFSRSQSWDSVNYSVAHSDLAIMCFARSEAGFVDKLLYPSFKLEVKPVLESLGVQVIEDKYDHHCTYIIARYAQTGEDNCIKNMSFKQLEKYLVNRLTALGWSYIPTTDSAYTRDMIPFYGDHDS